MGHCPRMFDQRLHTAQGLGQNENLCARTEFVCRFSATTHTHRDHSAESAHLACRHFVAGMFGQARIEHLAHGRMPGEERCDLSGVVAVPSHPQLECLQTPHRQVGIEGARHGAGAVLQERELGIEFLAVGDQRTAHHIGMPADVFRRRVQHDVGPQGQRLLQGR